MEKAHPGKRKRLGVSAIAVVSVTIVALTAILLFGTKKSPTLSITTCLQDAKGIRPEAPVAIAGVNVGKVRTVRAQPQDAVCPAYVEMTIAAGYELRIPKDSVVSTASAGLLGETYLEIETVYASGSPIENGGQLPSRPSQQVSLEKAAQAIQELPATVHAIQSLQATEKVLDAKDGKTLPAEGIRPKPKTGK